ncbi:MAG: class I SAM-dependent methyltransferase [Chloroflexi bacterium]|nr:class I SAM-dependent methyltransferase [Chloroflexota bacterium]
MSRFTDQHYLTTDQYRDSTNLDARIAIHRLFSTNPYGWFNWIFDTLVKLPADARILELGCGSAAMWKECADRVPAGWNITLSDLSQGMLDAAWRNLVVTGRAFKFEQVDAQSILYDNGRFDAVIANHMLYHVPDRPKALAEIKRVLKPGGRLIATTVGDHHVQEMKEWLKRASTKSSEPLVNPFTLENGLEQLKAFFPVVTSARYPDNFSKSQICHRHGSNHWILE